LEGSVSELVLKAVGLTEQGFPLYLNYILQSLYKFSSWQKMWVVWMNICYP